MSKLIRTVLEAADSICNGRDVAHAVRWAEGEMEELALEVSRHQQGDAPGEDGIIGEAVDVIQCVIDAVRLAHPDLSHDEIISQMEEAMERKCLKWREKYALTKEKQHGHSGSLNNHV